MSTKLCKYCRSEIDKKATVCPNCQRKQSAGCFTIIGTICVIICALLFVPPILTRCVNGSGSTNHKSSKHTSVRDTSSSDANQDTEEPKESVPEDYSNNEYYEIVDSAMYTNSLNYTVVIDKVMAKKSCDLQSTIIATDKDGNVVGKNSDRISLIEGEPNYFYYLFDSNVLDATLTATVQERQPVLRGEPNGVEMTAYNSSDRYLYLSLRQNCDDVSHSKLKVLFYKDDKIVHAESGHFSIYASNLTEKGAEDVAEILTLGFEYDRIEYIYEP